MSSRCKSCNAEIWWGVTEAGKPMPLDNTSHKGVVAVGTDLDGNERVRVVDVFTSHFATCPNAEEHRKR